MTAATATMCETKAAPRRANVRGHDPRRDPLSAQKPSTPVCCPACQHVFEVTLAERFWPKVDRDGPNGCWIWRGCTTGQYGVIAMDGRNVGVHRVALVLAGRDPGALHVDHLCRTTLCVNPAHLEAVTPQENARRAHPQGTHCKHGHKFTPANTYIHPQRGSRHCRACAVVAQTRYKARRRAVA